MTVSGVGYEPEGDRRTAWADRQVRAAQAVLGTYARSLSEEARVRVPRPVAADGQAFGRGRLGTRTGHQRRYGGERSARAIRLADC
ncbi:MAG TPA: hypothetical protein VG010_08585 [Solirubrobacteraceae bacterium]|nr:hypothetical protein [Solirubrobacteraceae bacterium]